MAESAALLVDEVLPQQAMRQWVLSLPFQLRFLFPSQPTIMGKALGIIYRPIATHITKKSRSNKNHGPHRRSDLDSAFRWCDQSQCAFSHAVSRWCLY
jgi:hypothetical protein